MTIDLDDADVLIVVDVQNDFLPGGALAVANGDKVIDPINRLMRRFAHVVLTQDWHTPGHISFASSHAGKMPFSTVELSYGTQVLWPDHCVQGTRGAALSDRLETARAELVIRKGYHAGIDSYSAFMEADRRTPTGLAGYLNERGFRRVYCVGLATDYCVSWTAIDARRAGFATYVIDDACRAIDMNGSLAAAWRGMETSGVARIMCANIA